MKKLFSILAASLLCASSALAQNAGTVTNHAFALGKGAGVTGYTSLLCTSAQLAVGQAAADPICQTITGDVTISAGGVTVIGTNKVQDTMLRQSGALALIGRSANSTGNVADIAAVAGSGCAFRESGNTVGCGTLATAAYAANSVTNAKLAQMTNATTKCRTTAGTGDPEDCTATQMRSLLSLVIGTNVEAWDTDLDALAALASNGLIARTGSGTVAARTLTAPAAGITVTNGDGVAGNPTLVLANDLAALEGLSSTGIARRTGTDAWSVGTLVSNSELATAAANTLKGNATGSTAAVTDIAIPSCSGANQAINWTSGTGPGCATIAGGGSGVWSNTRLAKTAAYTTVTGDCSDTLALGGSASFAATFNAPSGYAATCAFLALNEDTSFGKLIIPQMASSATSFAIGTGSKAFTTSSGLPITVYSTPSSSQRYRVYSLANPANFMSGTVTAYATTTLTILVDTVGGSGTFTDWQIAPEIRLWPGQSRLLYNQNNVWKLDNQTRWKLPAETELCVDASTGSDSNDGLGAGSRCFKTIQFASNVVYQEWDANNFPPDIGLYTGPFNESVNIQGQITGYNFLRYRTRAANTWSNTATCIAVSDNAEAIFDASFGFTQTWQCNSSNTANTGAIYLHQVGVIDIGGAHNWKPGGANDAFFFADGEGRATINGTGAGIILGNGGTVSGTSYVICNYHCAGVTTGGLLSYSGNLSLSGFYVAKAGSAIDHSANPTNSPGTGTISPSIILGNSVLRLNSLTPPGTTVTTANGGQSCATTC